MSISEIADALERAPRQGASLDVPEGARTIVLSDTVAKQITRDLRMAAGERLDAETFGGQQQTLQRAM